ncbi:hypothetical protein [Fischerella sp. PCC 9605]|uniref:hypothetical protein n=1 Tax=Fischerella sp. PCC 9605 TaxID=1173024 RepID=UPI00047EC9BD|nr:hypothetical protein [Fischerella sp. PCC 9605]
MQSTLKTFTQHLDLSQTQVETLLSKTLSECLNSLDFQQQLDSLDINFLRETLPTAGSVLAKELPPFYDWLKNELDVKRVPDSPEHTTNWVINFVNHQESLTHLVELHRPVPRPALETAIPRLVESFNGLEDRQVKKEWQKAIAILCLPLVVDAREREKYSVAV